MDTELLRSWCLELQDSQLVYSGQKEIYKINNKTFAIIDNDQISIKCDEQAYIQITTC